MPASNRPFRIRHVLVAIGLIALTTTVGLPIDRAAAAPVTGGGFTSSASTAPASVRRGSAVTISIPVTASTNRTALVDVEVYDSAGRKAYQRFWDAQSFTAGVTRTYTASWAVPANQATGSYRVDVGVFRPGWEELYHWNRAAATLTVRSASSSTTTTTTAAPTTTIDPPPTTGATTTTSVAASTTTAAPPTGKFVTLAPSSQLPTDEECAARVRRAPENRPGNDVPNHTRGVAGLQPADPYLFDRVTGNFTGTTDEIIQWASCKWGFDEDVIRAQTAIESWWHQEAKGDRTSDAAACPPGHSLGSDGYPGQCVDSWGVQQVRYRTFPWAFPSASTAPAITSTAYNLDIALAARRRCFEGHEQWLNTVERGRQYAAGDLWGCVGMWFSGRWYTQPSVDYIAAVQDYFNRRIWTRPEFQNS
jgi:autotransporter family porin